MKKALTKVLLVALMAIFPLSFYAQKNQTKPVEKYFYIFAEGGLSVNHTDLANYGFVPFYQEGNFLLNDGYVFNNFDGQLGLGYQFGKVMGVNAKFGTATLGGEKHGQYLTDFNEVEDQTVANKGFEDAMLDKTTFMEANLNLTFNLTNLFFGYNPRRVFNFIPHVGIGGIRYHAGAVTSTVEGNETPNIAAKDDAEMTFTVPVGAELNCNLARKLDFFIDYTFTFAGNDKLDQVQKNPDDIQVINDMYSSVNAGLRFKFNKKPCDIDGMCPTCINIYTVPAELEAKDDKVSFDIVYEVPAEFFEKEAVMHIVPTFAYPGGQTEFEPVILVGEKVDGGNYQVNYKNGGKYTKHYEINFTPDKGMENGKITSSSMLYVYDGQIYRDNQEIMKNTYFLECCNNEIANGIKYEAPVIPVIDTTPPAPQYQEVELGKVFFHYNKSDWKANYKQNKNTVKDINNALSSIEGIKEIKIYGWASPEGEYGLNKNLSNDRGETLNDKIAVDDNMKVTVVPMGPDWEGFYKLLQESKDFSSSEKSNIEQALRGISNDNDRQIELNRRKTVNYNKYEKILSPLRRATVVSVEVVK